MLWHPIIWWACGYFMCKMLITCLESVGHMPVHMKQPCCLMQLLKEFGTAPWFWDAMRLYWVSGHAGVRGNEITDRLTRSCSGQQFIGPEPCLGASRQNIKRKMKRWMKNQHLALWWGPCSAERQAWELISDPVLATGPPDYCPLTGHKPGLLLVCSLDITPWEDIYM